MLESFEPYDIPGKPWGREIVIAHTDQYLGKVLYMNAGHRGAMQYHERKDETFHLYSGEALVNGAPMRAGESYRVKVGTRHQVEAVTDCVFFECSTSVFGDRVIVGSDAQ